MGKKFWITLFLAAIVVGFISYSNTVQANASAITCPFNEPIFAAYLNLKKLKSEEPEYLKQVDIGIVNLCNYENRFRKEPKSCASTNFLSAILSQQGIKLKDLYFFFENSSRFAFLISGEFPVELFLSFFTKESINKYAEGFYINLPCKLDHENPLQIDIKDSLITICPANSAGEIHNNLSNPAIEINSTLKVFFKMLKANPTLAFEGNMKQISTKLETINFPMILKKISHIRFIASKKITKAQLYIPDEPDRIQEFSRWTNFLKQLGEYLPVLASFEGNIKNNSLFLTASPSEELIWTLNQKVVSGLLYVFAANVPEQPMKVTQAKTNTD